MRKLYFLFIFLSTTLATFSQQQYFLYFQAEVQHPFYARINEKVYSSSNTGYLIIPKLDDSRYEVVIGFPRNLYPEQHFQITLDKKDKGFQLISSPGKGWMLVNLQNQAELTAALAVDNKMAELGEK